MSQKPAEQVAAQFQPDYTPEQMENLGVYDALYRGQGPRLASLGEWKPEWVSEHDPKGWAQWYKRYSAGRRLEGEDERQIKRWLSFKARHGGPFMKNPTPKRGWALRNWGIDPAKLVAVEEQARVAEMLDDYKTKAMQKYVQERVKQAATTYYHGSPDANIEKLKPDSYVTPDKRIAEIMGRFHEDTGKPWSDDDLDQPYDFGPEIHFKPGREPTGKPTVYAVATDPANLDLLDNPYEHKTKLELAVQKYVQERAKQATVQAQRGDVFPVSCHEHGTEAEPGQVSCAVPALSKLLKLAVQKAAAQIQTQIQTQIQKQASNAARRLFTRLMKDTAAGNLRWHGTSVPNAQRILADQTFKPGMYGSRPGLGTLSRHLPLGRWNQGALLGFNAKHPAYRAATAKPTTVADRFYPYGAGGMGDPSLFRFVDGPTAPISLKPGSGVLRWAAKTSNPQLNALLRRHGARLLSPKLVSHLSQPGVPGQIISPGVAKIISTGNLRYAGKPVPVIGRRAALQHVASFENMQSPAIGRRAALQHVASFENMQSPANAAVFTSTTAQPWWRRFTQQISGHVTPLWQRLTQQIPGLLKRSIDEKAADLNPDIQLQDHQQRIADRTLEENPRMLVYHGLGSGKSLSAIAAAEAAKKQFGDNYGIAVPASLRGNFQKEINKFTRGSDPEIMSYTGLALGKQFRDPPATLIMDEAHRLRNPDAASSRGAQAAAQAAKRVLLLTGSPITNSPSDLANLLGMLHNKKITPEEFEKRYIDYKKVNPGIINWFRGIKPGEQPIVKNEKELRELLKGKVDYQPSKTPEGVNVNEEIVRVPLSPQQQKIQKAIRTKVPPGSLWKLDAEFPLSRDELAKLNSFLTGMRQVSLSTQPFRADKDPVRAFEQSAKLQEAFKRLKETLDSDKRKKAIIYSNFIDSGLAPYAAGLEQAGVPHAFFHGGVSAKARQAAVEAYNKGKLRALLIGPAGAEGLSTKGTSLIQLMDPHWHESRSQQARGRGLRFDSHHDLPEELKNVAVQRFISSSENPSWLGKLMGYSRERTGDEVLERLALEKEKLNEVFRKILREEGTQKTSADLSPQDPPSRKRFLAASAPPTPVFTNHHFKPPRPPMGTGTVAGSYKVAPPPGPVTLKVPMRTGHQPIPDRYSGDRFDNPTTHSWDNWLDRNYVGDARINAHDQIGRHLAQTPGAQKQYQAITNQMFTRARAQSRQPFDVAESNAPLRASHIVPGTSTGRLPVLSVGTGEQYMGQKRTLPYSVADAVGRAAGLSANMRTALTGGKNMKLPSLSRGIVGVHEMEHVNADVANFSPDTNFSRQGGIGTPPVLRPAAYVEPAAIMNEIVHATDAAHQATGKPVPGEFALTDNYRPELEWMRRQALQHGLANMGPAGTGNKTMQELLNTPEGQQWLRMQIDDMPDTPQIAPADKAVSATLTTALRPLEYFLRATHQAAQPLREKGSAFSLVEKATKPKKKKSRMPWVLPALGGLGVLSTGAAYGLASDAHAKNIRTQLARHGTPLEPGETALSRYNELLAHGANSRPFGFSIGDILSRVRSNTTLLKAMGVDPGYAANKPGSFIDAEMHYDQFRKGPISAYAHMTHPNKMMNNPQFNVGDQSYVDYIKPHFQKAWDEFRDPNFGVSALRGNASWLEPHEIDMTKVPFDRQVEFMRNFHKNLPPDVQAARERAESGPETTEGLERNLKNYLPVMRGSLQARDILKGVGAAGLGAGAGGGLAHYLMRKRKHKNPLAYWASVLGGTGLGAATGYFGGSDLGRQQLADAVLGLLKKQQA